MPAGFVGRGKETRVFGRLRQEIEATVIGAQIFGPDSQLRFCRWGIDLVYETREGRLAVEGKYKILSDGAVPDNRKAAFFDLYKLEKYVASGGYVAGLFLWLTDEPGYRQQASGDSADFSTHDGRLYNAGAQLNAARSRNPMPLPLALKRSYKFNWNPVEKLGQWYSLAILVDGDAG
jgi:hypothetical protein